MGWREEINKELNNLELIEYLKNKLDEHEKTIKNLNNFIKKKGLIKKIQIPDSQYIGKTYGKLTVLRFVGTNKHRQRLVEVKCSCSKEKVFITTLHSLKSGHTKSCGCGNKTPNRYDLSGDYGIGYDKKDEEFYFDLDDYDKIKDIVWYVNKSKRVVGRYNNRNIFIHKLITNTNFNQTIDHINLNPRDNRKENLRIVTQQQNAFNRRGHGKLSKFGVKGVSWVKLSKKWVGLLSFNRKNVYSKYFDNISDAIVSQIEAEKIHFGIHRYKWEDEIKWDELLEYEKEIKNKEL